MEGRERTWPKKVLLTSTTFFQSFRSEKFWALQNKHKKNLLRAASSEYNKLLSLLYIITLLVLNHIAGVRVVRFQRGTHDHHLWNSTLYHCRITATLCRVKKFPISCHHKYLRFTSEKNISSLTSDIEIKKMINRLLDFI